MSLMTFKEVEYFIQGTVYTPNMFLCLKKLLNPYFLSTAENHHHHHLDTNPTVVNLKSGMIKLQYAFSHYLFKGRTLFSDALVVFVVIS